MASSSSSASPYNSPCAACKFLRRKCVPGCIFSPYFPPDNPQKFANVHKIFGASNVAKILNDLLPHQREDAVNSLAYEAEARVRDPVYGCVGAISFLQRQVQRLQKELDAANADLLWFACDPHQAANTTATMAMSVEGTAASLAPAPLPPPPPPPGMNYHGGGGGGEGGFFDAGGCDGGGGGSFGIIPSSYGVVPWNDGSGSDNVDETRGGNNVVKLLD